MQDVLFQQQQPAAALNSSSLEHKRRTTTFSSPGAEGNGNIRFLQHKRTPSFQVLLDTTIKYHHRRTASSQPALSHGSRHNHSLSGDPSTLVAGKRSPRVPLLPSTQEEDGEATSPEENLPAVEEVVGDEEGRGAPALTRRAASGEGAPLAAGGQADGEGEEEEEEEDGEDEEEAAAWAAILMQGGGSGGATLPGPAAAALLLRGRARALRGRLRAAGELGQYLLEVRAGAEGRAAEAEADRAHMRAENSSLWQKLDSLSNEIVELKKGNLRLQIQLTGYSDTKPKGKQEYEI